MLWRKFGVGAAWVVAGLMVSVEVSGGIVVMSRESSLAATGQTSADDFILSDQSAELGLYDQALSDSLPGDGGGTTSASASQRSDVPSIDSLDGFATGDATAQVAELDAVAAQGLSQFFLAFDVTDQTEQLTIQGHVASGFDAFAGVTVRPDQGATLFERIVDVGEDERLEFNEVLSLSPGLYRITAEARADGTPTWNAAEFDIRFTGGGATVIPLPPALLGGAVMMALGAIQYARVRYASLASRRIAGSCSTNALRART